MRRILEDERAETVIASAVILYVVIVLTERAAFSLLLHEDAKHRHVDPWLTIGVRLAWQR